MNIGGISNVSVLRGNKLLAGFDTGPGNGLLDAWIKARKGHSYDEDGNYAKSGECDQRLLEAMLGDPYFSASPPKSTGKEHFNLGWLQQRLEGLAFIKAEDVQCTLAHLTALSVAKAVEAFIADSNDPRVFVCGGGAHNGFLMGLLDHSLNSGSNGRNENGEAKVKVTTTEELGVSVDDVEAMAFAWLAFAFLEDAAGNLPQVTGGEREAILGGLYKAK